VQNPREVNRAFKLPKIYVKLMHLLFYNINWVSTTIGIVSTIVLYFAKFLNEQYKSKIRIILPSELILVGYYLE
jgi:hypothetical protein